jgi:Uma2 family endonuclease
VLVAEIDMATVNTARATPDDLHGVEGKAELIGGKLVRYMGVGVRPNQVASNIFMSLHDHARPRGHHAFTDSIGFIVPELASGRESFSPDTSYYDGPLPADLMDFVQGAPTFGVEVRSKNSYSKRAERAIAAKRTDYFQAGTKVVWDVDPVNDWIDCYRADAPDKPVRFKKGDIGDAEPAVPGWRIPVDEVFA